MSESNEDVKGEAAESLREGVGAWDGADEEEGVGAMEGGADVDGEDDASEALGSVWRGDEAIIDDIISFIDPDTGGLAFSSADEPAEVGDAALDSFFFGRGPRAVGGAGRISHVRSCLGAEAIRSSIHEPFLTESFAGGVVDFGGAAEGERVDSVESEGITGLA